MQRIMGSRTFTAFRKISQTPDATDSEISSARNLESRLRSWLVSKFPQIKVFSLICFTILSLSRKSPSFVAANSFLKFSWHLKTFASFSFAAANIIIGIGRLTWFRGFRPGIPNVKFLSRRLSSEKNCIWKLPIRTTTCRATRAAATRKPWKWVL